MSVNYLVSIYPLEYQVDAVTGNLTVTYKEYTMMMNHTLLHDGT